MALDPSPNRADDATVDIPLVARPFALWVGFGLVHAVVALLALVSSGFALGDVTTHYQVWAADARAGFVPGIDFPWVYPIAALLPIVVPAVFGPGHYVLCWLILAVLLDAAAFAVLVVRSNSRRRAAAWWWLGFTLLLGPIAVSRLDGLSAPIVIVGLLWLAPRPRLATVILTVATWIKVWPIAVLGSLVVSTHHRWRVMLSAAATSAFIVAVALACGSGSNVLSFVGEQTGRALQVEAPVSTVWMWEAAAHLPGTFVYYDRELNTFQVTGSGVHTAAALMTPLLLCAVVGILLVGVFAVRANAHVTRVLPPLTLALVTAMIAFDKVVSPQYIVWLAAPIVIGLAYQGGGFRVPAILVAGIAALTQAFYPYLYDALLLVNPAVLVVLTARNILLFVVLGWSLRELIPPRRMLGHAPADVSETRSAWPFTRSTSLPS